LTWDGSAEVDHPDWVASARMASVELAPAFLRHLRRFRRDSGQAGVTLIRGLPVAADTLPPTPNVPGSVQRTATVAAATLLLIACALGEPAAFRAEKGGALVQDVVPVPGKEQFQGNMGSVILSFHNENAFHQHRPDFVMLLCLRSDHERVAGLRVAGVREVLPHLSAGARAELAKPQFITAAPPSFGAAGVDAEPHPVLGGDGDDPDLRVDLSATTARDARATEALAELGRLFAEHGRTVRLVPGDLAIVDNRVTVHGRTAFRPRYDGQDRWLQRTFVLTDLRRSRDHRPGDGQVLAR
ncbi:MAG: TauD/TfdA family dioxygenase, partial [Catenulispora sp.]